MPLPTHRPRAQAASFTGADDESNYPRGFWGIRSGSFYRLSRFTDGVEAQGHVAETQTVRASKPYCPYVAGFLQ